MVSEKGVGYKMNETKKMMDIIHQNCKKKQLERKLSKMENEKNLKKREYKSIAILLILAIAVITLGILYNEKQIKNCMELGGSENFCRYAGE